MGAKKKPQETLSLADLGVDAERGGRGGLAHRGARARTTPPARGDSQKIEDDGTAAREDRRLPRGEAAAVKTLVFLEHHEGELQKGALGVLSKAAALGGEVAGVVARLGRRATLAAAGRHVRRGGACYVVDDPRARGAAAAAARRRARDARRATSGFDTVLFAASVLAADVAAGLAARLDAGLNWDLVDLAERRTAGSSASARRSATPSTSTSAGRREPRLALIRSGTFEPAESGGERGGREVRAAELEDFSLAATMVEQAHEESEGPSIEDADVIVAGGRGLGEPGELRARRGAREGARRRGRGDARGRRRGLVPVRDAGRPDRQDGRAEALRRVRHLGRDPAQGRDAELGRRSSRSTRTRTRRSSSSPTSASSATCTRSSRS